MAAPPTEISYKTPSISKSPRMMVTRLLISNFRCSRGSHPPGALLEIIFTFPSELWSPEYTYKVYSYETLTKKALTIYEETKMGAFEKGARMRSLVVRMISESNTR